MHQPPYPPGPPYSGGQPQPPYHAPAYHGQRLQPAKSGVPKWLVILLVAPIALFMLAGVCAAIAIPAVTKYMRRSKTSEARVRIAMMFDAVAAYHSEHGACPTDEQPSGSTGPTPPLSIDCNLGMGGRCLPGDAGPGGYPFDLWYAHPVWDTLRVEPQEGHYFHYEYQWEDANDGECTFVISAYGDLDQDYQFSTFKQVGAADGDGVHKVGALESQQEVE